MECRHSVVQAPNDEISCDCSNGRHNRKGGQSVIGFDAPHRSACTEWKVRDADIGNKSYTVAEIGGLSAFHDATSAKELWEHIVSFEVQNRCLEEF